MTIRPLSTSLWLAAWLAVGASLAVPAAAQTQWKWRDARGVQYSDRPPPPEVAEKDILQRPANAQRAAPAPVAAAPASAASAAAAAPAVRASDPQLEAKKREAEEKKAAEKKAEEAKVAKAKAENCERARAYLRTLEDGIRIARTNDKGEREIIDDKQRAQETERTKQVMSSDCAAAR